MTGVSTIIETQLARCCDFEQHFTNFGSKIFNDDLDASHYLYDSTYRSH